MAEGSDLAAGGYGIELCTLKHDVPHPINNPPRPMLRKILDLFLYLLVRFLQLICNKNNIVCYFQTMMLRYNIRYDVWCLLGVVIYEKLTFYIERLRQLK